MKRILLLRDHDHMTGRVILEALREHGYEVEAVYRSTLEPQALPVDPLRFDLVLGYGPHNGSMLPVLHLFEGLLPHSAPRPLLVWWLIENLPRYAIPTGAIAAAARLRVAFDRWLDRSGPIQEAVTRLGLRPLLVRGHRLRTLGELFVLRSQGWPDVLAAAGAERARFLRRFDFPAVYVPFGYHWLFGRDLGLERDIDVAFVGIPGSRRRQALVRRIARDLAERHIRLTVCDGSDRYLDDDDLIQFLNRCKVLLNVLKDPNDAVWHRLLLGAANGALVVSEPLSDYGAFEPGRHLISVPVSRIAEQVEVHLAHEDQRRRITGEAYRLVSQELTIRKSLRSLLHHCEMARAGDNGSSGSRHAGGLVHGSRPSDVS